MPVSYGLTNSLKVNLNDKFYLIGSHDEVSFWFDIKNCDSKVDGFMERRDCTCEWHSNLPPSTIMLWNNQYSKSKFVEIAQKVHFYNENLKLLFQKTNILLFSSKENKIN